MQSLSREFLLERMVCCGNGCKNCPYTPKHIKGNKNININRMKEINLLDHPQLQVLLDNMCELEEFSLLTESEIYKSSTYRTWIVLGDSIHKLLQAFKDDEAHDLAKKLIDKDEYYSIDTSYNYIDGFELRSHTLKQCEPKKYTITYYEV